MESASSLKRLASLPRTRSAASLNTAERQVQCTPPNDVQTPSQQPRATHQAMPAQQRSSQQQRPDQASAAEAADFEGHHQQPSALLTRQGSKGLNVGPGQRAGAAGHNR